MPQKIGPRFIDHTGKRFNKWSVIGPSKTVKTPGGQTKTYWQAKCDCGKVKYVYAASLVSGKSKSCNCIKKGTYGHSARRNMFSNYFCKARRRGVAFEITEEQFYDLTQKDCYYCGKSPSNISKNEYLNGEYVYSGLDRVDNSKGYSIGNIVPSCKNCNKAKLDLTTESFFDMIKSIYERHIK